MAFASCVFRYPGLAAILVGLALLFPVIANAADPLPRDQILVLGRVSSDAKNAVPKLEELVTFLAARLKSFGIQQGQALVARDNAEMVRYLREGKVDLVSETAFSAVRFETEAGAEFLLREWKKKVPQYHTVFFTREDSSIRSVADLAGRKIAFEDSGSTSSFLVPMAVLHRAGLETVELTQSTASVPGNMVGYAFAETEVNIPMWVMRGVADAGAFNNLDWVDLDRNPNITWEGLRVFHTTRPIMRSAMLARNGLPREMKTKITEILLGMKETSEGKAVLKTYYKVNKFDRIEGEVADSLRRARADYAIVRRLIK
jgi:phosphate/phosphite/phosphonate ABC transporter binding protein